MNQGVRFTSCDVEAVAAVFGDGAQEIARVQDADDVVGLVLARAAGACAGDAMAWAMISRGGRSISSDLMALAVDHHVGDGEFAEIERAAQAIARRSISSCAVLGGDVDQAFDLGAGEHVVVRRLP